MSTEFELGRTGPVDEEAPTAVLAPRTGSTPAPEVATPPGEVIAQLLVAEGAISAEQLKYARRVRNKLHRDQTLLTVLADLGVVKFDQIQATLRRNALGVRLGVLLTELGYVTEEALQTALKIQEDHEPRRKLGDVLVEGGFLSEDTLLETISYQTGFPRLDLVPSMVETRLANRAPLSFFRDNDCVPVEEKDGAVLVAFADPLETAQVSAVRKLFGANMQLAIARRRQISEALQDVERRQGRIQRAAVEDSSAVGIVDSIIQAAIDAQASDIHLEPMKDRLRVRFRHDGVMKRFRDFPADVTPSLTSRIKILAKADIAERRRHQDGRMMHEGPQGQVDIRMSSYVTVFGEKIVLRLLQQKQELLDLRELGMAPRTSQTFKEEVLELPSGILLITGPTGSGKTTTLYSCVNHLNDPDTCIISAEDPVEYVIEGISQCSINAKINVTYEETLRAIVRQDPDVIVIGEVRDQFSANVAVQCALTGHKVLTTFHTEDSNGALIRLLDMGIEPFMIASTVTAVLAQRLLRRICRECAADVVANPEELRRLGYLESELPVTRFRVGRGCKRCQYTGYRGRLAVHELLVLNDPIRDAILARRPATEIRRISTETTGLASLLEDGIKKAAAGETTLQEVLTNLPRLAKPRPLQEIRRILGEYA